MSFALSQYLARASLMIRGVVAAALVGPQAYGLWNALQLLLEYSVFSQIGTQQGLDQQIPQRIVEGDAQRLQRTKRAGLFNILMLALLSGPLVAVAFRFTGHQILGFWGMTGILLTLGCMLLNNVINYHGTLLRSHGDIQAVSTALMLQSVLGAAAGLALAWRFGVWGLLWGMFMGYAGALFYARLKSRDWVPLDARPARESWELLRVGVPIFLFMSSMFVLRTVDRMVVLRYLGATQLGYYTLSIMAVTFLLYLPESVSYVLYPRLVTRYRESKADPSSLADLVIPPLRALSLAMPALSALGYLASGTLVHWFLPAFQPGVTALRILSFGTVGLALASIPSFVLITLGRLRVLLVASVALALLAWGLDVTAYRMGFGIRGVAMATLVAYLAYGLVLLWLALGATRRGGRPLALMVRLFLPLAVAVLLARALEHFTPIVRPTGWAGLGRLGFNLLAFCGLYSLFVWPLTRGFGLGATLREFRWTGWFILKFPTRGQDT